MSDYEKPIENLNLPLSLESAVEQTAELLNQAGLAWGHGVDNAEDEAAWLVLAACEEPLGQPDYAWSRILSEREVDAINALV